MQAWHRAHGDDGPRSSRRSIAPRGVEAVETAWQPGIAVVASAGNAGPADGTILSPGDDPLAITVGSLDDGGSMNPFASALTSFSSVGPTNVDGWFKPDLVTSGRSVVSLRAPGSTIDTSFPSARVGSANFVGSGTSFSAAVTSGSAALLIQGAAQNKGKGKGRTLRSGSSWNGSSWSGSSWSGSSWSGSSWNGSSWSGSSWNASSWNGSTWNGSSWNGSSWNGSSWS